jgi:regulator of sigma E protease
MLDRFAGTGLDLMRYNEGFSSIPMVFRYLGPVLILSLAMAAHELGHVLTAWFLRIRLERFALGFGPTLIAFRRRETQWVLGAIPIGAFGQIHGMNPHAANFDPGDRGSFGSRSFWTRGLVLAAGPLANFALALSLLTTVYWMGTHVPVVRTVGSVEPGSEAAKAQIRPGDVIIEANGRPLRRWSDLVNVVENHNGELIALKLVRDGEAREVQVRPGQQNGGPVQIGVRQQYLFRRFPPGLAFMQALAHLGNLFRQGTGILGRMARENVSAEMLHQFSEASAASLESFLRALSTLSLALGMLHLLPFPPLDGGRLALIIRESAQRRPLHPRLESLLHAAGMVLLCAALGWLFARDVARWIVDGLLRR